MPGRLFVHAAYRPGLAYHAILDAQCPVMRLNPLFMPLLFVASGHAAGLEIDFLPAQMQLILEALQLFPEHLWIHDRRQ